MTSSGEEIDAHILYDDRANGVFENNANDLERFFTDNKVFDDVEVQGFAGSDKFGEYDIVVVQDIDPTSAGHTAAMIGLIAFGTLFLMFLLLKFTTGKFDNGVNDIAKYTVWGGLAILGTGASVSAGYGLHLLSGDMSANMGGMIGCGIGFLVALVLMIFVFNLTRANPYKAWTVSKHVIGAALLVTGSAMLTNLAGEAFGETIIDQYTSELTSAASGLGWADVFMTGPCLFVGFFWFFWAFFQPKDVNAPQDLKYFALGAAMTTASVLGGAYFTSVHIFEAGIPLFVAAAAVMVVLFLSVRHGGLKKALNAMPCVGGKQDV